jgi:hypothetical protein
MKLIIRRNQADVKGLFGGHKGVNFALFAKVDILPEEKALIERYKVHDYPLAQSEFKLGKEMVPFNLTVDSLVNGSTTTTDSIATLLKLEADIKEGCQNLKSMLSVMATFGGEETIEI